MTRAHLKQLLEVIANNQLDNGLVNNYWSEYLWFGTKSRYGKGHFDNDEVTFKSGDTGWGPRFRDSVTNQSPAAARYGWVLAQTMMSECYLEGYGSRDLRLLSELYINWLCRDEMYNFNFYEHPESCGEEGLRGPLDQADDALRHMYDAVCRDEVLAGIFIVERGYRKGKDAWVRKIFK